MLSHDPLLPAPSVKSWICSVFHSAKTMKNFISSCFLICLLLNSCSKEESFSVGPYFLKPSSHTKNFKSKLVLSATGEFEQTVSNLAGANSTISGTWKKSDRSVIFDHFLYLVDLNNGTWINTPNEVFQVTAIIEGDYIIFREDSEFIFQRDTFQK